LRYSYDSPVLATVNKKCCLGQKTGSDLNLYELTGVGVDVDSVRERCDDWLVVQQQRRIAQLFAGVDQLRVKVQSHVRRHHSTTVTVSVTVNADSDVTDHDVTAAAAGRLLITRHKADLHTSTTTLLRLGRYNAIRSPVSTAPLTANVSTALLSVKNPPFSSLPPLFLPYFPSLLLLPPFSFPSLIFSPFSFLLHGPLLFSCCKEVPQMRQKVWECALVPPAECRCIVGKFRIQKTRLVAANHVHTVTQQLAGHM